MPMVINQILDYMLASFSHTWPYLLATIPIAVLVKMAGAIGYVYSIFAR